MWFFGTTFQFMRSQAADNRAAAGRQALQMERQADFSQKIHCIGIFCRNE
jgi:hypothetical protein